MISTKDDGGRTKDGLINEQATLVADVQVSSQDPQLAELECGMGWSSRKLSVGDKRNSRAAGGT
jgi:hypothetical protein